MNQKAERLTGHQFQGSLDRWCEICDLPDRHPIHQPAKKVDTENKRKSLMRLWLLTPIYDHGLEETPWRDYGVAVGFVIRAETDTDARNIASANAGIENDQIDNVKPWEDTRYSRCVEVSADGPSEVILDSCLND